MSRAAALLSCALSAGEQNNFVWFTPIILQQLDCPWVGVVLQHVGHMGMIWCVHAQSVGPGGPSTAITCVQRQQVNWQKSQLAAGACRTTH